MEVFDLYDKDMNILPRKMVRGGSNNKGEYHLVVHIWFRNQKGEYLIQQRNKLDDYIPFQWAITGGAVSTGETSIEGAIRETEEEIGLRLEPSDLTLVKRYFIEHPKSNYITDLYLVTKEVHLDDLVLDPKEVKAVAYASMDDIHQMISNNTFWDYEHMLERKGYFTLLEKS